MDERFFLRASGKRLTEVATSVLSSFCCSYVFTTHLLHSWFFYTRCAEKFISPPADLHSSLLRAKSLPGKGIWGGKKREKSGGKKKEQSSSGCMNFHQETENWNLKCKTPCRKEPQEINIRPFKPWAYIFCRWLLEIKSIISFPPNLLSFFG